jgi:hypothetical protein
MAPELLEISGKKTFMLLHCYDIFLQQAKRFRATS